MFCDHGKLLFSTKLVIYLFISGLLLSIQCERTAAVKPDKGALGMHLDAEQNAFANCGDTHESCRHIELSDKTAVKGS